MEIHVKKNIAYHSPVTGELITTREQRKEDLKRTGCIEYDTEMKTDYETRQQDATKALDKSVDAHVEEKVAKMTGRQRERLMHELEGGADAGYQRSTRGG